MKSYLPRFNRKDFWRYPLERNLLKPLLKDSSLALQFEISGKVWSLNGQIVHVDLQNKYSKLTGIWLFIFHRIQLCFNCTYRKKFNMAKAKIEGAYASAQQKTERLQLKCLHPVLNKIASKEIKTAEDLEKLIEYLFGLSEAIQTHDTIQKEEMIRQITAYSQFNSVNFNNLTSFDINHMIECQKNSFYEKNLKSIKLKKREEGIETRLKALSFDYQNKVNSIDKVHDPVFDTPIRNRSSVRRPLFDDNENLDESNNRIFGDL